MTGVVDPDIELFEACDCVVHDAVNVRAGCDVRDDDMGASITPGGDGFECRLASCDEYDGHRSPREKFGGSRADAAARARDDDDGVGHARFVTRKAPAQLQRLCESRIVKEMAGGGVSTWSTFDSDERVYKCRASVSDA